MTQRSAERVREISYTTGTGPIKLMRPVPGFRTLADVGCVDGDTVDLEIESVSSIGSPTGDWEIGTYTWGTGGVLTRTTIVASSNGGAAVDWNNGTRWVRARAGSANGAGGSSALSEILAPLGAHYIGGFAFRGVSGAGLIRAFDTSLATAYPMASAVDAELHATPGYVSILAGANKGLAIPKLEMDLSSYPGRNLVLAWGMKKVLPSAEEPIMGTSASATGAAPGLNFSTLATGKLKITGQTTQGTSISLASSLLPVADAAGNPHVVMVADHSYINRLQVIVDAQFSNNVSYGAAGVRRDISQVSNLVLGGIGGTDQVVYANQFSALHALWVPDRFTKLKQVAELLTANISMPLQGAVL